jgi:hypothetical protein
MNGQIIAGINQKPIGQALKSYKWESFDFPEGGEKKIKNFPISEYPGFYQFLKPLIVVKNGKIFLKKGVTKAKWDKERLKADARDSGIKQQLQKAADAKNKRIAQEARKRAEQLKQESIACRSKEDYEKAVDKPKRDRLHNINKYLPAMIAARGAFLALLRLNVLGLASVFALKFAKEWEKWKGKTCRVYNTDWSRKGRESIVAPPVLEKIQRILYNLGFEPNSVVNPDKPFSKAIGAGMEKKAIGKDLLKLLPGEGKYEKTLKDTIAWYKADGRPIGFVDGVGAIDPGTAMLISSAAGLLSKLLPYILNIFGVSEQAPTSECDIQDEEIDKLKEVNKALENDIMTLEGEQGIGQVPSIEELGLPPKLDYIENESPESKITRATKLYDTAKNLFNSFKSTFSTIKEGACNDLILRYQAELNKFEILQKELKRLSGKGSLGDLGKFLPYIIGGAALYFLMAKRKK